MLPAPAPSTTASRWDRVRTPVLTAAGLGLATLALRLRDPHDHGSWGLCPFRALTGWDCPGCGGLRAVNDLTHGRIEDAWHSNALFLSVLPLAVALWVWFLARGWTGSERRLPGGVARAATLVGVVVALAFTVYRNTPAGASFLAS